MKKILFIFLLVGGFTQATSAQEQEQAPNRSVLRVSLTDNTPITIALDNRYFRKHGPVLTVGDLPRGKHRLKVYSYSQRQGGAYANLLFDGKVRVEKGTMTVFVLDPNSGNPNITTDSLGAGGTIPPPPPTNNNTPGDNAYSQNQPAPIPADANLMPQDKIDQLKTQVNAKETDTQKTKLMEKQLAGQQLSTAQVKNMMSWFEFESSKVDFAKWAYAITVDKPNYHSLENQFQYKRSQDDLESFINKSK